MTGEENEILIAVIGAIGGIIVALALIHKNAADVRAKEKENDNQAGKLALDLATSLKAQLDTLEEKTKNSECEIAKVKELAKEKEKRNEELERKTQAQEKKIEDLDRQVLILRRLNQEKDEIIADLKKRLEAMENGNGVNGSQTPPKPTRSRAKK